MTGKNHYDILVLGCELIPDIVSVVSRRGVIGLSRRNVIVHVERGSILIHISVSCENNLIVGVSRDLARCPSENIVIRSVIKDEDHILVSADGKLHIVVTKARSVVISDLTAREIWVSRKILVKLSYGIVVTANEGIGDVRIFKLCVLFNGNIPFKISLIYTVVCGLIHTVLIGDVTESHNETYLFGVLICNDPIVNIRRGILAVVHVSVNVLLSITDNRERISVILRRIGIFGELGRYTVSIRSRAGEHSCCQNHRDNYHR